MLFILNFDTIYSELFYIWCLLMKIKVKNRSMQDMSHMGSYLSSFLPYAQKKMGFNRPPTIFFDSDTQNADKVLGKTGYYNPETDEIVVYVDKRHPKDILRSLSHELVHHTQNCRGDLEPEIAGETSPGYAQSNSHMRNMESEAYELGSGLYFRDWEDSLKNQLEETNYKHITGDNHKMATYDQLKEEITAKVVASITEKLKNPKKADLDKDGKLSGYEKKRGAAIEKSMDSQSESVEEGGVFAPNHYCLHHGGVQHEGKIHMAEAVGHNWSKKEQRVTHYDMKLEDGTVLENVAFEDIQVTNASLAEAHHHGVRQDDDEDELEERRKRDTPRDSDRREAEKLKINEEEEELDEAHCGDREEEELEEITIAGGGGDREEEEELDEIGAQEPYVDGDREEEENLEETISNDEWYQNQLFESLTKKWAK